MILAARWRRLTAEFIGTALLVTAVVGSAPGARRDPRPGAGPADNSYESRLTGECGACPRSTRTASSAAMVRMARMESSE
jgi:hypothetical protein